MNDNNFFNANDFFFLPHFRGKMAAVPPILDAPVPEAKRIRIGEQYQARVIDFGIGIQAGRVFLPLSVAPAHPHSLDLCVWVFFCFAHVKINSIFAHCCLTISSTRGSCGTRIAARSARASVCLHFLLKKALLSHQPKIQK